MNAAVVRSGRRVRRARSLAALEPCEARTLVSESLGLLAFSLAHNLGFAGVAKAATEADRSVGASANQTPAVPRGRGSEYAFGVDASAPNASSRAASGQAPIPSQSAAYASPRALDSSVHSIFDAAALADDGLADFGGLSDGQGVGSGALGSQSQAAAGATTSPSPGMAGASGQAPSNTGNAGSSSNSGGSGVISAAPTNSVSPDASAPAKPAPGAPAPMGAPSVAQPSSGSLDGSSTSLSSPGGTAGQMPPFSLGRPKPNGEGRGGGPLPSGVWDNPSGVEGQSLAGPLATFAIPDLQNGGSLSNYSATITLGRRSHDHRRTLRGRERRPAHFRPSYIY